MSVFRLLLSIQAYYKVNSRCLLYIIIIQDRFQLESSIYSTVNLVNEQAATPLTCKHSLHTLELEIITVQRTCTRTGFGNCYCVRSCEPNFSSFVFNPANPPSHDAWFRSRLVDRRQPTAYLSDALFCSALVNNRYCLHRLMLMGHSRFTLPWLPVRFSSISPLDIHA